MNLVELVRQADHIVRGRVMGVQCYWNSDSTQIHTTMTLEVSDVYSGEMTAPSIVPVVTPGGIMDGLAMEVEHTPVFQLNDDVILFLTTIDDSTCRVTGWEAGKFSIHHGRVSENRTPVAEFEKNIQDAVRDERRNR